MYGAINNARVKDCDWLSCWESVGKSSDQTEGTSVLGAFELLFFAPHFATVAERDVGMTAHITNCVYIVINANERNGFSVDNNLLGGCRAG